MQEEYGSTEPIGFAESTAYDGSGNEMLCACGKSSAFTLFGKEAFVSYCSECYQRLISQEESPTAKFVFRDPSKDPD